MRVWKLTGIILLLALCMVAIKKGYLTVREKLLYRAITQKLTDYSKRQWGADLIVGKIGGNLLNNLYLGDISLVNIKGFPPSIQIKMRSIKLHYNVFSLFRRDPKIEISGFEVWCEGIKIPIKISQQNGLIMLNFNKEFLYFAPLAKYFFSERDVVVRGFGSLRGNVVLSQFKLKLYHLGFESDNFEVAYKGIAQAKAKINLAFDGATSFPQAKGTIIVEELLYTAETDIKDFKQMRALSWLDNVSMDIGMRGDRIHIRNKSFDIRCNADISIKKGAHDYVRLLGRVDSIKGRYSTYQNKFKITNGKILFSDAPKVEVTIDIAGETSVKGYRIMAKVLGTLDDSNLELTSRPILPRDEVLSLLLFGKRLRNLGISEKIEFSDVAAATSNLISKIFLGKAEAKIAEVVGLDTISVQTEIMLQSKALQVPSLEVGKYIGSDGLYGTYKIQPSQVLGQKTTQVVTAEYIPAAYVKVKGERNFNDSISLPQEDKISVEFQWIF
ncbi:MAG: translocation/assembly module TamB [Candidatus Omnitrophica bacterium]|nr:translocation/assembly module TamB [Candidatus Omnitrophota bacterium]